MTMDVPSKIVECIVVLVCTDSDSQVEGNNPPHFHTTTHHWHYEVPTEMNTNETKLHKI